MGVRALLVSGAVSLTVAHARLPVQIRGASRLDADVSLGPTEAIVRGNLQDELGEPLAAMRLKFASISAQRAAASASSPIQVTPCQNFALDAAHEQGFVETSSDGRFCARLPRERLSVNVSLQLTFDGSPNYAASSKTIALDDLRASLKLELTPGNPVVDLDRPEFAWVATLQALNPENLRASPPLPLELSLVDTEHASAQARVLQRLQLGLGTPTPVPLETRSLGAPGPATIRLTFDGSALYKPFRTEFELERTASVHLSAVQWPRQVTAGERLLVKLQANSVAAVAPAGFVEVTAFGAAPQLFPLLADGTATVPISSPRRPGPGEISIRFQPSRRGWIGTSALRLPIELLAPSKWNAAAWAGLALLVLAWFAWSRRRVDLGFPSPVHHASHKPHARIELLESTESGGAGWSGVIVDAHEGSTIAGAIIELRAPGFERVETLFSTTSDDAGHFSIPVQDSPKPARCRLEIRAPGYARLGIELPVPGRVKVFLVSVRRAVLERFVDWTKRRGHPYDSRTEPTPDWVAKIAKSKGQHELENWAKSVAIAAFGQQSPVDSEVPDLQPPAVGLGAPAGAKRNDSLSNG